MQKTSNKTAKNLICHLTKSIQIILAINPIQILISKQTMCQTIKTYCSNCNSLHLCRSSHHNNNLLKKQHQSMVHTSIFKLLYI